MSAETDRYFAEGYESGATDIHKWMRRAERAEARSSDLEAVLRRVDTALDQTSTVLWNSLKEAVKSVLSKP